MTSRTATRRRAMNSGHPRAASVPRPHAVWFALAAVVVVAAVIAVVTTHGSGSSRSATGVEQTRPVQVVGDSLPTLASAKTDPAVGALVPELHGASFDGTPVAVARDGTARLVLFVAHWCPHCRREVPMLASYLRAHSLPAGVQLVTIATATNSNQPNFPPSAWLADESWPAPVLADSADSAAAKAFGLPGYPYFVAIDRAGHVVDRTSGEISTDEFAALAQEAATGTAE